MTTSPSVQTITVILQRPDSAMSWGFRLQGGTDFPNPLAIQSVTPDSPADKVGLRAGDAILRINEHQADELTHDQAKQEIVRSGDRVEFLLQRASIVTWTPTVAVQNEDGTVTHKTSLAANKQTMSHIGTQFNRAPRPFPGSPAAGSVIGTGGVKIHTSPAPNYNNPSGLYSSSNLDTAYNSHADALSRLTVDDGKGTHTQHRLSPVPPPSHGGEHHDHEQRSVSPSLLAMVQKSDVSRSEHHVTLTSSADASTPQHQQGKSSAIFDDVADGEEIRYRGYTDPAKQSRSFRLLEQGLGGGPGDAAASPAPATTSISGVRSVKVPMTSSSPSPAADQKQLSTCKACGTLIVGMVVRVKGDPLHPECFKCASCGLNLRNQGYFVVESKIYCETHAIAASKPPAPDMVATPVYR